MNDRLHIATLLASAARDFHARGWMWGTSGNLSAVLTRDPLAFLITASGRDKGELTADDTLLVGAGGEALEEWHGKPSAEMPVHERIYAKFRAGAVYHVHTVMAGVLSDHFWPDRGITLEGVEMLKGFGHDAPDVRLKIPIADNHSDSNVIADLLEEAVQPGVPGVLIRNHGLYAWGDSPQQARNHLEVFEYLFQYTYYRTKLASSSG
ncbi:MAG: methylthioribulose 1-phosphate dehydratase [Armatimonadetes bacterium]|nr:methylthioribulose 1-phosphate dehydratase [Armatimonadota bacterium]